MNEPKRKKGWAEIYFPEAYAVMASGRLTARFTVFEEVTEWVKSHGNDGELKLRVWLECEDSDEASQRIARVWLAQAEARRVNEHAAQELELARDSVTAARKSAKWTMFAAFAAAVGTAVTAIVAIAGFYQSPKPIEIKVLNAQEFRTVPDSNFQASE